MDVKARLDRFVERLPWSGCWIWTGSLTKRGYGHITIDGQVRRAHQVSYESYLGNRNGFYVLHRCDIPACINPEHLYLGTHDDNMRDMIARGRVQGERNGNAIVTPDDVRRIRVDQRALKDIASDYGISRAAVSLIKLRKRWNHVV